MSVIVTTFGRDIKLLNEAIDSVLKQIYKNIEIILVDDNGKGTE